MKKIVWFLSAALFFTLPNLASAEKNLAAAIDVQEKHIDFMADGKLVGRYHIDPAAPRPHFHPVHGPDGQLMTRGFPMVKNIPGEAKDHIHHRAIWFCHGDVIPEGLTIKNKPKNVPGVDFWMEYPGHGKIVCVKTEKPIMEGDRASVVTHNEWRASDGQKIMDEKRTLQIINLESAKLLVFDIDLHAGVVPITFGDTKEGSFAIRVAETMPENKKLGGIMENADGKRTEKEVWGRKSLWCDYSGPVGGKTAGLTIFDHAKNPYPAYWHARGYGLMAANPFGRSKHAKFPDAKGNDDLVKIAKGDHLKLRYGVLIHPGNAKDGKVAEHFQTFVRLP